jgi:MFS family permease
MHLVFLFQVVGPMLGGYLGAHGDYQLGALLAAGGSVLSALLTLLMPAPQVAAAKNTDQPVDRPSMWSVVKLVWPLLLAKTLTGFANAMRDTAQPLILKSEFQFGEREMGITMAVTAAANAVVNGLLLGQIASFFGSRTCTLIADCVGVSAVLSLLQAALLSGVVSAHTGHGLFGTAFHLFSSHRLWVFLFGSFLLTIVQYLLATAITSESTARVDSASRGTLIGLEHSLYVFIRAYCFCFPTISHFFYFLFALRFAAARIASPATSVALMALGGAADGMSLVQCGGASLFVLVWFVLKACQQPSSKSKTA